MCKNERNLKEIFTKIKENQGIFKVFTKIKEFEGNFFELYDACYQDLGKPRLPS